MGWYFCERFPWVDIDLRIAPEAVKLFPLANCDANMWRPGSALEVGFSENLEGRQLKKKAFLLS